MTTLYERKELLRDKQSSNCAVALAAELKVQNFSEIDSITEVRLKRA